MIAWFWLACADPAPEAACATGDCRADVVALAVGDLHVCLRRANGVVACAGSARQGQRGSGRFADEPGWTVVRTDAAAVAAGAAHTCALSVTGAVSCWGRNDGHAVSRGGTDEPAPVPVPLVGAMVGIAVGDRRSCAWDGDGAVWCWGGGAPVPVRWSPSPAVEVAIGAQTCARERSGDVVCEDPGGWLRWSAGARALDVGPHPVVLRGGQVVVGRWEAGAWKEQVLGEVPGADALQATEAGVFVRDATGRTWGWRWDGTAWDAPPAAGGRARSGASWCAVDAGAVVCDGPSAAGGRAIGVVSPRPLGARGPVSAGGGWTCVGVEAPRCWGEGGVGTVDGGPYQALRLGERLRLGVRPDGAVVRLDTPDRGAVPLTADSLDAGADLACARGPGGEVTCWTPDQPPVTRRVGARAVAVGGQVACAVDGAGAVSCWDGVDGVARGIPGLHPAQDVRVGASLACAASPEGVWCWNHWTGASAPPSPAAAGVVGAVDLDVGMAHACAVDLDGAVWCWGRNDAGQLGDGTRRGRARAARVPGLPPAARVAVGHAHSCAEARDGAVWCWGHPWGLGLSLAAADGPVRLPLDDSAGSAPRVGGEPIGGP